jgi:hypothetical protein
LRTPNLPRQELLDRIEELRQDLGADIGKVSALSVNNPSIPLDATVQFLQIEEDISGKNLTDMTDKELRSIYRDLNYIRDLESSKPSEVQRLGKEWADTATFLKQLSEEDRKSFWKTFSAMKAKGVTNLGFKYTVLENLALMIDTSKDGEADLELAALFDKAYTTAMKEGQGKESGEWVRDYFMDLLSGTKDFPEENTNAKANVHKSEDAEWLHRAAKFK